MSNQVRLPHARFRSTAVAVSALLLALAGCGGGGSDMPSELPADVANADDNATHVLTEAAGDDGREDAAAVSANATVPGTTSAPYPTLQNLSLEWAISGDANHNGVVNVRYRPQGSSTWKSGMALRRVPAGSNAGFSWSNRHSGSVFDLQPNTSYEVELSLSDPDGGSAVRTLTARTRPVPAPMANARVRAVTPSTFASVAASALPGDVLQLGAGTYPGFTWNKSGTAGKPIVIRSSAGAVINGNIDMFDRSEVHLSGLTINGRVRINRCINIAITRNTIRPSSDGIVMYLPSVNSYIADNTITGRTTWASSSLGVNGNNIGEGILVTGPGHVIMNNRVTGFRDNISFLEQGEAVQQYSIDVLNNDLRNAADDAIEADYCFHNCRIMRNRITNAFMGVSSQPSLGGPTYMMRNAMYNVVYSAFKLHNRSIGDVVLHNTVVKSGDALGIYAGAPIQRALFHNNLFIGGPGGTYGGYNSGPGKVAQVYDLDTSTSRLDYDAYGSTAGGFGGRLGGASFTSLAGMRSATSEKHAVQVSLSSTFAASVGYPSAMSAYAPPDLRPRAGSPVENAALRIANVNDGYAGSAPDIGAFEVGASLPLVGPR